MRGTGRSHTTHHPRFGYGSVEIGDDLDLGEAGGEELLLRGLELSGIYDDNPPLLPGLSRGEKQRANTDDRARQSVSQRFRSSVEYGWFCSEKNEWKSSGCGM